MRRGVPGLTFVLFLTLVVEINIKEMRTEEEDVTLLSFIQAFILSIGSCSTNDSIILFYYK